MKITSESLLLAYRKVKVDLFYSSLPYRLRLLDFEKKLAERIPLLEKLLTEKNICALKEFCHGYSLAPKKVDVSGRNGGTESQTVFSDPQREYPPEKVTGCQLRIMTDAPIEFHVIMNWWLLQIGARLEKIVSNNSYGNRIRRCSDGNVNMFSLGTYKRYLPQYRSWRDNGLKIIESQISQKKNVVSVTADFTAFYHTISASFLTSTAFLEYIRQKGDIVLNDDELAYTQLVVDMLDTWAKSTPLKRGLPVGCPVSSTIANLSLMQFDDKIEKEVVPLYYGRYVDDIILVLENTTNSYSPEELWKWLATRIDGLDVDDKKKGRYSYCDSFLPETSPLFFGVDKTKVFYIDSGTGELLLNTLKRQIRSRSSEWRSLPEFPEDCDEMTTRLLSVCNCSGEEVDNLRKVDVLTLRRAAFAMVVRDFESYDRNLTPAAWREIRQHFLMMIDRHFTDVKSIFDLYSYYPRIISVACNCLLTEDEMELDIIVSILKKVIMVVEGVPFAKMRIAGMEYGVDDNTQYIMKLVEYVVKGFYERIICSVDSRLMPKIREKIEADIPILRFCSLDSKMFDGIKLEELCCYDLAYVPARVGFMRGRIRNFECDGIGNNIGDGCANVLPNKWRRYIESFKNLYGEHLKKDNTRGNSFDMAFAFPTRPFNVYEISDSFWKVGVENNKSEEGILSEFISFERGYLLDHVFPSVTKSTSGTLVTDIPCKFNDWNVKVALANWMTKPCSYNASVCQMVDPDEIGRYNRLMRLVNQILLSDVKVRYVVFPELSLPKKWFDQIAFKLRMSNISLIAGIEYVHEDSDHVRNQAMCSLMTDQSGFLDAIVCHFEKARPALHEADELYRLAKKALISDALSGGSDVRPIIRHGDSSGKNIVFSTVVCSDLTNIHYRSQLQGKIDVLFVPSWNKDAEVFSSLVESAAYDIHAYVIECNDRVYGDTRIRAPVKKSYNRDIVRIKGGEMDYFVVGRLDIEKLRKFQTYTISPSGDEATFKPVPSGFSIEEYRKELP